MALLIVALFAGLCRADGFIIIHDPPHRTPGHFGFAPLEVTYHRVSVEISDLVATTRVDQEFYNPNNAQMEGTYMFPLPPGSHIDRFTMDVNGKMLAAELLPADKARAIYEEIVRKYRDPALLEYVGRDAFKVRIFPIEPHSKKKVQIKYTQLLKSDSGLAEYIYPLNTEKFSAKPLKDVAVKVTVACKEAIKSIYCPSHNVDIRRDGEKKATVGFEGRDIRPDTDFKLYFSQKKDAVGIDLLTFKTGTDDGYFMMLASPGLANPGAAPAVKDIAFVVDTSGSMLGAKLDQARKALRYCLANLNAGDRFEIVRFSTEAEPLFNALKPADKENMATAEKFVDGFKPTGATAIAEALGKAMEIGAKRADADKRPYLVMFLTDGLPTMGDTREDAIVDLIKRTGSNTRVFCFGIGADVNTHMLDRIAQDTKALSQYVLANEDIEVKVASLYEKVKEPVATNLTVEFGGAGIRASQLYPNALPDLFKGDMMVVFGRYSGSGAGSVKVTGTVAGQQRTFAADVNFAKDDTANAFIPQLWATRRVGWLLDELRMRGESKELREEITKLAREFGIVTPYTAYLIMEDERGRGVPLASRNFREFEGDAVVSGKAGDRFEKASEEYKDMDRRKGDAAVARAQDAKQLREAWNNEQSQIASDLAKAPTVTSGAADPADGHGYLSPARNYVQQARVVNGRAFYQNGKVWNDSTAQSQQNLRQQKVKFNSEEYFALIKKHPNAMQWLSLGNDVDVVLGDTLYQIRDEG